VSGKASSPEGPLNAIFSKTFFKTNHSILTSCF
jgi:hypothetical protein